MRWKTFLTGLLIAAFVAPGVMAAERKVDVELIFAIDVSGSVDDDEARLQRQGYVQAFRNPDVIEAVVSGFNGRIAVFYFEFSAWGHNKVIADWRELHDETSIRAFADFLEQAPIETVRRTSISEAIAFAIPQFDMNEFDGPRKVIDVSGDGANNTGPLVTVARDAAVEKGITINGLAIVNGKPSPSGRPALPDLDLYYEDCVIGGKGSFLVVANGFEDFAEAIRKKLLLEIAGLSLPKFEREASIQSGYSTANRVVSRPRAAHNAFRRIADAERLAPPCDIGERRWEENW